VILAYLVLNHSLINFFAFPKKKIHIFWINKKQLKRASIQKEPKTKVNFKLYKESHHTIMLICGSSIKKKAITLNNSTP
jgi:hypothetical protein